MATFVESLHCANCGAPLNVKPGQALAACVYCNSTLRVAAPGGAGPAVTRMEAVPPEVVDEVKRSLVLGNQPKAVEYYAAQTGLPQAEAAAAVAALQKTVGYWPPLTWLGVVMLVVFVGAGLAAAAWGVTLLGGGRVLAGAALLVVGALWALINGLGLGRGLSGFVLVHRGAPAEAVIVKRWTIKTLRSPREPQPVELVRFLLEVQPEGGAPYQTEANGMVRQRSIPKTQPGGQLRLHYDRRDPRKVVVMGPVDNTP